MRPPVEKMNVWTDFDGHYEKHECDIMLKNGTIIHNCWPNGGEFNELEAGKRVFKNDEISKLRYHDYFSRLKEKH